jgi:flagellar motor protein MotB
MLKRTVLVLTSLLAAALTGCRNEECLEENNLLRSQLAMLQTKNQQLVSDRLALEGKATSLEAELNKALADAAADKDVVARLKARKQELEAQNAALARVAEDYKDLVDLISRDGQGYLVMKSDILFASGKTELLPAAKEGLDGIADYLLKNPGIKIRIDGHTDGQPIQVSGWQDNYHLACMRALAVRAYLEGKGVDAMRMLVAGFGPNLPMKEPETPTAPTEENRRVEILVEPERTAGVSDILEDL